MHPGTKRAFFDELKQIGSRVVKVKKGDPDSTVEAKARTDEMRPNVQGGETVANPNGTGGTSQLMIGD